MAEEAACTPPVAKSSDRAVAHTLTAPGALVMQGPATSLLFLAVGLARVALHCSWLTGRHSCSGGGGRHQVGWWGGRGTGRGHTVAWQWRHCSGWRREPNACRRLLLTWRSNE